MIYDVEKGEWQTIEGDSDLNEMYLREMRHFIECVKGKESPLVDGRDGKRILEMALAAKESSRIGKIIPV
jgi:predicted dehydrogenase